MSEWYFAYGSNLLIEQMVARTGLTYEGDDLPRIAHLANYRLAFNMQGDCGQMFANIVTPGAGVIGVIYRCTPQALEKLDVFEQGYERRQVLVVNLKGETLEAITYIARVVHESSGRKPSHEYLQRVLNGGRQQGLPEAYLGEIEAIAMAR